MDIDALQTLRYARDGHVGRLHLHRPEKLNAMTAEMWAELRDLGAALVDDPELRVLVVTGEGRAFSSGIDTSVFGDGAFAGALGSGDGPRSGSGGDVAGSDAVVEMVMRTQDAFTWLATAPFATIAAVRGYALGAGLQLALACDLRVFARGATVGLLELQYGIMPDLGGTQRLPRLVGPGKAKELILTRAKIDAEEAHHIGLCERLVDEADLDPAADALATTIASQPPLAVRGVKEAVRAADELDEAAGLRVEAERQAACLASEDLREALAAFVSQREPTYRGR